MATKRRMLRNGCDMEAWNSRVRQRGQRSRKTKNRGIPLCQLRSLMCICCLLEKVSPVTAENECTRACLHLQTVRERRGREPDSCGPALEYGSAALDVLLLFQVGAIVVAIAGIAVNGLHRFGVDAGHARVVRWLQSKVLLHGVSKCIPGCETVYSLRIHQRGFPRTYIVGGFRICCVSWCS